MLSLLWLRDNNKTWSQQLQCNLVPNRTGTSFYKLTCHLSRQLFCEEVSQVDLSMKASGHLRQKHITHASRITLKQCFCLPLAFSLYNLTLGLRVRIIQFVQLLCYCGFDITITLWSSLSVNMFVYFGAKGRASITKRWHQVFWFLRLKRMSLWTHQDGRWEICTNWCNQTVHDGKICMMMVMVMTGGEWW